MSLEQGVSVIAYIRANRIHILFISMNRCKRKIQIDVAPKSLTPYTDSEKSSKIVSFEVRGGKPCEYQPAVSFLVLV